MSAKISIQEAVEIIRRGIRGELEIKPEIPGVTWDGVYAGDVGFWFGDWMFVFFNDCDELDYTDSVRAPDGRVSDCDEWSERGLFACPLNELSEEEIRELESRLKAAK